MGVSVPDADLKKRRRCRIGSLVQRAATAVSGNLSSY